MLLVVDTFKVVVDERAHMQLEPIARYRLNSCHVRDNTNNTILTGLGSDGEVGSMLLHQLGQVLHCSMATSYKCGWAGPAEFYPV